MPRLDGPAPCVPGQPFENFVKRGRGQPQSPSSQRNVLQTARRMPRDLCRGLEGLGISHLKGRREIHLRRLRLHGGDDLVAAMARVDALQPRGAIENAPPFVRRVVHPLRSHQQTRRAFELTVRREGHPERGHIG